MVCIGQNQTYTWTRTKLNSKTFSVWEFWPPSNFPLGIKGKTRKSFKKVDHLSRTIETMCISICCLMNDDVRVTAHHDISSVEGSNRTTDVLEVCCYEIHHSEPTHFEFHHIQIILVFFFKLHSINHVWRIQYDYYINWGLSLMCPYMHTCSHTCLRMTSYYFQRHQCIRAVLSGEK